MTVHLRLTSFLLGCHLSSVPLPMVNVLVYYLNTNLKELACCIIIIVIISVLHVNIVLLAGVAA
jgi:hypothetical protein